MKTYVLTVAQKFHKGHPREGQETGFVDKIPAKQKIHTIRRNYALWKKRAGEINAGKAILSLRYWKDRPYRSKQIEFARLSKIGVQCLEFFTPFGWFIDDAPADATTEFIAGNDGLSLEDFRSWFDFTQVEDFAIIHFTDFRYKKF